MSSIIYLRPHHFLCMLTYAGRGYTVRYTENFNRLVQVISCGKSVAQLVSGPDDICAPRLEDSDDLRVHCNNNQIQVADERSLVDIRRLMLRPELNYNDRIELTPDVIHSLRVAFKEGQIRTACQNCEWRSFCNELSQKNFVDCLLKIS